MSSPAADVLTAPYTLQYKYRRSLGPILSAFVTGLRDGRILGSPTSAGVVVPPIEYDPKTAATIDPDTLVEVGTRGVVETWTWVTAPRELHPIQHPFAYAMIRLDGANTAMLHVVDTGGDADAMTTGMRVAVRWADERGTGITDIACFVPEEAA